MPIGKYSRRAFLRTTGAVIGAGSIAVQLPRLRIPSSLRAIAYAAAP